MSKIYIAFVIIALSCSATLTAQSRRVNPNKNSKVQTNSDREKAFALINQGKILDALPLLEKVAATNPSDAEFWAQYGIAIMARVNTLTDADDRKREVLAARSILSKARDLGTTNASALDFLKNIPEEGGDASFADDETIDNLIREGEKFYGSGDYENAFKSYQRAHQINPKNYFAALFAGDTFYARKMYTEADKWFAKAVAIDIDRETAHRFWADSLLFQGKLTEARNEYIEAIIADPSAEAALQGLGNWSVKANIKLNPLSVVPPGGKYSGGVAFDENLLKATDGTKNWLLYNAMRQTWQSVEFKNAYPNEKTYRHSLREESAALRIVASKSREDLKDKKVKQLHESLTNLIKLDDAGLLESYVLFVRSNDEIAQDYEDYRKSNRDKMRRFFIEAVINAK